MRIFVTGTGRCGTSTFYHACTHIKNFTCGLESISGSVSQHDYPDNHIEISSQLVPAIGYLCFKYPRSVWVHLIRDKVQCMASLKANCPRALRAYSLLYFQGIFTSELDKVAEIYYDLTNCQCRWAMPQSRTYTIRMETAARSWASFWETMGFEGDFNDSLSEWNRQYNPTGNRGRDNYNE